MRELVFNEAVQLGIGVRDLEATVRRYVDDYVLKLHKTFGNPLLTCIS